MKFPTKGSLTDTSFIEILKDAAQSGLTGMIRLENAPIIKVVYFQKGTVSFAASNEKSDRLTEVLKRAGKLTPEQVQDAQTRLKPNVSLGKTLQELGYISGKDLLWGARSQVDGILHQLLFSNQGKYQVLEGTLPREIIHLNLPVTSVIFEGIMKTQNREWILQHIGSPEAIYAVAADFEEQNRVLKLPASDVVSRLNGRQSLHEIAEKSDLDTFEICKTVVALEYLDLARPVQDEPLQMTLAAPEEQEPMVFPTDPPEPTSLREEGQELGQVLHLPTVEELGKASDKEEEEEAAAEIPEPEPVTTEAKSSLKDDAEEISEPEPEEPSESKVEIQPVQVEPALDLPVPMQSMVRNSKAVARTAPSGFHWKPLATILLAAAFAGIAAFYYMQKEDQPAKPSTPPVVRKDQPAQITSPVARSTESNPPLNENPPDDPLRLLRDGRVADAAKSWNDNLTKRRHGYSIQLVIACQAKTVVDTHRLLNYSEEIIVLPLNHNGQICHRVLFGQFSSRSDAKMAIEALPEIFIQQSSPASVVAISDVIF